MTPLEQQTICKAYELGSPLSVRQLGGTRNRNFLLTTSTGDFFVRHRYAGYSQADRLAFDHATLKFLAEHNVPVVAPKQLPDGKTYLQADEKTWEVFPAISGRPFQENNAADLQALTDSLAQFHLAGRDFPLRLEKLGARGETDPAELLRLCQTLGNDADRYREWIESGATELTDAQIAALPSTLIHGDIQPANVLINQQGRAILIDLDWCAWRARIYDLAFAVLLCCSQHPSPIRGEDIWSLSQRARIRQDLVELFLSTYDQHGWPLEPAEAALLGPQIILSWCHVRLAGAMKVEAHRRAEFLNRPPERIEELFSDRSL